MSDQNTDTTTLAGQSSGTTTSEEQTEAKPLTYAEKVNATVKLFKDDGTGKMVLPADLDEGLHYAAMAEKRRRDTESTLGKTRSDLAAASATNKAYLKKMTGQQPITVTAEVQAELDDLMISDPNAWRQKVNALEQQANTSLNDELSTISAEAAQAAEVVRREDVLTQFNLAHPDAPITDAALASDIPPRITKQLTEGTISFDEFLTRAYDYLVAPKTTVGATPEADPNLGAAGGSSNPSNEAQAAADIGDYSNTLF